MSRKRQRKDMMKAESQPTQASAKQSDSAKAASPVKGPTLSPLLVLLSAPSGGGKTTLGQQLLATRPDMSVRNVAVTVGFDDVSYFHRAFAAQFHMTPLVLGRAFSGPVLPVRRPRNHRLTPPIFTASSTAE